MMMMKKIFLSVAVAACMLFIASQPAFSQTSGNGAYTASEAQLSQILSDIRTTAHYQGTQLNSLSVTRNNTSLYLGNRKGNPGLHTDAVSPSCTVSAQVIIAGTGVTVSATAATCAEAAQMVLNFVKNMPHMQ